MIPSRVLEYTKDLSYTQDSVGRSKDTVYVFENKYILKVSDHPESLLREKERIDFLTGKLPCPKSIDYFMEDGRYYYLRTCINGRSLIDDRYLKNPELLLKCLKEALDALRVLDSMECPYRSTESTGNSFVHGDFCLPNIYMDEHDHLSGFIDLDGCGKGDAWLDYSWMLWSLMYNLKTDEYNDRILSMLGEGYNEEKYKSYIPEECLRLLVLKKSE